MKTDKIEQRAADDKNWAIPVDGTINVPDYLDPLINKVGFQLRLYTISKRVSEPECVCRIVYSAESFFKEKEAEWKAEADKLREALRDIAENWDCDKDGHKYSTGCRKCSAKEAITNYDNFLNKEDE